MNTKRNNITDSLDKNTVTKGSIPDNFQYIKKDYKPILCKARFTIKRAKLFIDNLTYKKINDWDGKKILSGTRDNKEAGWRKFSIIDIVKLLIVSDLRKLGFNINKIIKILKNISQYSLEPLKKKYNLHINHSLFLMDTLEIFFLSCLNGNMDFLIINGEEEIFFFDETDLFQNHFYLDQAFTPIIILPFFDYVKRIAEKIDIKVKYDKDPKLYELFKILPLERKILDIINNKKYESITITKQNGEIKTIKPKEIQRGGFSDKEIIEAINKKKYQKVSTLVKDGKRINVTREETIKF